MDEWQIKHITKNLTQLVDLTTINSLVKTKLVAKEILCKADVDKLDAVQRQNGEMETCRLYYLMLMTRTNAYKVLYETLKEANQSGAYTILIRVPPELYSKPLTYLGISFLLKNYQDVDIEVNGKKVKFKELFSAVDYESLQQVFQDCLTELEIYDTFITKHQTFVLATNTVPPKPPYYVPRFLSNRIKITESILRSDCRDVFVFRNTIPRYKLSQLASPNFTTDSTSQLINVTCRFIYLDDTEDWVEMKKIAKVPIHLINCEENGTIFILEDSSAPLDILRNLGSKEERVYISEKEFATQQISEDCETSSVCICDTPGMGKTLLLANVARCMIENSSDRLIVFIPLAKFSTHFEPANSTPSHNTAILNVLKYTSTSHQNNELLIKLIQAQLLQMEVFFDGFDEVPSDKSDLMKQILLPISTKFPNVRMFITSRPHLRQELEKSLGVIAYDILPFNQQNQIDFLTHFWTLKQPRLCKSLLQDYATSCLGAVNKSLTETDKEITGIPLLCQLIGEIFSDKKALNSIQNRKFGDIQFKLSKMYSEFIEQRINHVKKNEKEFESIKLAHVWHALQLLFPISGFQNHNIFEKLQDLLTSPEILRAGIIQKHSNAALEFLHRTFAEYLVAEYFVSNLHRQDNSNGRENNFYSLLTLELLLEFKISYYEHFRDDYAFVQPVIVSFFNSSIGGVAISEELNRNVLLFVKSTSQVNFISILRTCCQHNVLNIFSLLMQSLIKWEDSFNLHSFTYKDGYNLLGDCIESSSSQMFRSCVQTLTEAFQLDVTQLNEFDPDETLLQLAVRKTNYEVVEYFLNHVPLQGQRLLEKCSKDSYCDDKFRLVKRENILQLLLNKDSTLIQETRLLACTHIHVRLIIFLVKSGANLNVVDKKRENCLLIASSYMSPNDFHELVHFLLKDCKAEYLFLKNETWAAPVPDIVERVSLMPQTLKLVFSIPGINRNMKDIHGENLLFSAVQRGQLNNVQQLVSLGLDYNERCEGGRSLLHVGADDGGPDMVEFLLSLKLDPNSRDKNNCTPLHYAVRNSHPLPVVRILMENGANVEAKSFDGQTAFYLLANIRRPDKETIKYMIGNGADVNCSDKNGNTPLHLCKTLSVFKLLIEMGADVHAKNKKLQTILHVFVQKWKTGQEIIKYLAEKGVKVNSCDEDGNTPLHLCKTKLISECLIGMGADMHAKNNKGQTVLHVFAKYLASGIELVRKIYGEEMIKYYIEKGVKVNSCDEDGNTPLHLCISQSTSKRLIEAGADIHAKNNKGQTVLHILAQAWMPEEELIKYYVEKGVEVNSCDEDGNTPFCLCKTWRTMECLIEMGADIHVTNKSREKPPRKFSCWIQ